MSAIVIWGGVDPPKKEPADCRRRAKRLQVRRKRALVDNTSRSRHSASASRQTEVS
jgi:hypothetical protein